MVRTELWPHTIANEEDGEDTTCEDISLAKFLKCFGIIMTTCEGKEAKGRPVLLLALTSMLEYLPWAEVRTFHNLVMVKLEQDRISWSSDFVGLAEMHLDKKVRQSLRAKTQPGNTSGNRASYRNSGRGSSGANECRRDGQSRFAFYNICRQWNDGNCTFGVKCRKWHCCGACGRGGKLGEPHQASSSDCPSTKKGRSNQRS